MEIDLVKKGLCLLLNKIWEMIAVALDVAA